MRDSQKAESDENQKEPVPSSEPETNQSQEAAQSEETSEAPAGDSEKLELDDEVKQRTAEQFEKLKDQLRQTREELFQMKDKSKSEKEEKPIYDPSTGLVDVDALEDIRREAKEAKQALSQFQKSQADKEIAELYSTYPELKSPKTESDKQFFDEAEKLWVHSMSNPDKYGGQPLTQKQAADLARKNMTKSQPKKEESESKEQASASASGKPTQGVTSATSEEDLQRLRMGTRLGDRDSMVARMRAIREAKSK